MVNLHENIPFDEGREYDIYALWVYPVLYNRRSLIGCSDWQEGLLGHDAYDRARPAMGILIEKLRQKTHLIERRMDYAELHDNFIYLGPYGKLLVLQSNDAYSTTPDSEMMMSGMAEIMNTFGDRRVALSWPRQMHRLSVEWALTNLPDEWALHLPDRYISETEARNRWHEAVERNFLDGDTYTFERIFAHGVPCAENYLDHCIQRAILTRPEQLDMAYGV